MPIRGKYQPVTYLVDARIAAGYQSREDAAIRVPYAAVTIGRHERGEIRLAPDDIIIYAKAYNAPEIMIYYCRNCCPIGHRLMRPASGRRELSLLVTQLGNRLRKIAAAADRLADIADDNVVDASERSDFDEILALMRSTREVIDCFELYAMLADKKKPAQSGDGRSARAASKVDAESVCSNYTAATAARQRPQGIIL